MNEPKNEPKAPRSRVRGWTPDLVLQGFKELVTAILGVTVVVYTLVLAGTALSYVDDSAKMGNAKDILLLVLGLAGVVIGYYFGRVPADARAAQATQQADQANAQAQDVTARAAAAADQVDDILARTGQNAAGGGPAARGSTQQDQGDAVGDLRRLRDTLRSLSHS